MGEPARRVRLQSGHRLSRTHPDTSKPWHCSASSGSRSSTCGDIPFERYDLVVIGTLMHVGYNRLDMFQPLPGLDLVERIGRPSISVVHDPVQWNKRCPEASFDGRHPGGWGTLNLFRDHSFYWQGRLRKKRRWSREGERLVLWEDGRRLTFSSTDRGATYRGPNGMALRRRPGMRADLRRHTRSGRHAIVTFSRQAAENLKARCPSATWIVPFASDDGLAPAPPGEFVFAGSIDYRSKAVSSLLSACATLAANESVVDSRWQPLRQSGSGPATSPG